MGREATLLASELQKRFAKLLQEKLEAVGSGVDTEQYKYWTGYIRCLKDASGIIEEVLSKIDRD